MWAASSVGIQIQRSRPDLHVRGVSVGWGWGGGGGGGWGGEGGEGRERGVIENSVRWFQFLKEFDCTTAKKTVCLMVVIHTLMEGRERWIPKSTVRVDLQQDEKELTGGFRHVGVERGINCKTSNASQRHLELHKDRWTDLQRVSSTPCHPGGCTSSI